MPFDLAAALFEDLGEERNTSNNTGALGPESSATGMLADDKAGIVKRRRIFCKPACDDSCPRGRQLVPLSKPRELDLGDFAQDEHMSLQALLACLREPSEQFHSKKRVLFAPRNRRLADSDPTRWN